MSDDTVKDPIPEHRLPPARVRLRRTHPPTDSRNETPAAAKAPKPEYEVGYRKPPQRHQFQPGKSGNPRGRPKGAKSISTLVDEALSRKIKVKIGGRTLNITQREAMVRQYVDKAMRGDHKAFAVLMKLDPRAKEIDRADDRHASPDLNPEEAAILLAFLKSSSGGEDER